MATLIVGKPEWLISSHNLHEKLTGSLVSNPISNVSSEGGSRMSRRDFSLATESVGDVDLEKKLWPSVTA